MDAQLNKKQGTEHGFREIEDGAQFWPFKTVLRPLFRKTVLRPLFPGPYFPDRTQLLNPPDCHVLVSGK